MKYEFENSKLRIVLDELGEEYKNILIQNILSEKNEVDIESISVSDIIKIDSEFKESLYNKTRRKKYNRTYNLVVSIGLMYALLGVMLLLISAFEHEMNDNPYTLMAIVFVFIGFMISLCAGVLKSFFSIKDKNRKKETQMEYEIEIVNNLRVIEDLMYKLTPNENRDSIESMSNYMVIANFISREELMIVDNLSWYRNLIVHKYFGKKPIPLDEMKVIVEKSNKIIKKLKTII